MDSFLVNAPAVIFKSNPDMTQMKMLFCSIGFQLLILDIIAMRELKPTWISCAQHPYVYGVLVLEACATFTGQLSVLSVIAFLGAATTAMMKMLFCSIGFQLLILDIIAMRELKPTWISCAQHPYVYGVLVLEACATFTGQLSVLSVIAFLGAATTAMPLTKQHCCGFLLMCMGIIMKMLRDNKPLPPRASENFTSLSN
ncbi:UDP-galactose/UDP-glucose transporter 4-like isoform X1 [Nicotiana tabacum]|uniref:UDP-galactose/UDP-glucose transporter 4-like isoform X1 n=5 Tax=Nicotiana TaxID=4085 RepID=A0AC58RMQ9_TOBAC